MACCAPGSDLPTPSRCAAPPTPRPQDGVARTGVSLAYTVLRCDAGPVLEQAEVGGWVGGRGSGSSTITRMYRTCAWAGAGGSAKEQRMDLTMPRQLSASVGWPWEKGDGPLPAALACAHGHWTQLAALGTHENFRPQSAQRTSSTDMALPCPAACRWTLGPRCRPQS